MKVYQCFLAFFIFFACINHSFSQDLYDLYRNSVSRKPFVTFTARDGAPGHAFVIVGEELDNGLIFELGVFGFYPKDGKKYAIKAIFSTDGVIDHKWADIQRDQLFRVDVTKDQQDRALDIFEKWKSADYSLFGNNCNKLSAEVAEAIGLKLPDDRPGSTFPSNYVKALREVN